MTTQKQKIIKLSTLEKKIRDVLAYAKKITNDGIIPRVHLSDEILTLERMAHTIEGHQQRIEYII